MCAKWYDGFRFGQEKDIYNPWSILNYLDEGRFSAYWVNTSSNSLAGKLIREESGKIKQTMEELLAGKTFRTCIDEQIVFGQLNIQENAIWSLLLAGGYLRVERCLQNARGKDEYELALTNREVHLMFEKVIGEWFAESTPAYNDFVKALLLGDVKSMNVYMNRVALATFSYFDTGNGAAKEAEPERFYHGFVLGLMVELTGRYVMTSNRESGFGRYDVMLEPCGSEDDGIILEFKVYDGTEEKGLEDTVKAALSQIEEKKYAGQRESGERKYGGMDLRSEGRGC